MATVNTVLGPVDASQIGGTMSHVHLTINILCWFREPDSGVQRGISEQKISLQNLGFVRRNAMLVKGNRSHSKLESALQLRYEKRHYEERAASAQGIVGPDSAPGPSRDVGSGGRIRAPHSGLGGGGRRAERTAQPECVQLLAAPLGGQAGRETAAPAGAVGPPPRGATRASALSTAVGAGRAGEGSDCLPAQSLSALWEAVARQRSPALAPPSARGATHHARGDRIPTALRALCSVWDHHLWDAAPRRADERLWPALGEPGGPVQRRLSPQ